MSDSWTGGRGSIPFMTIIFRRQTHKRFKRTLFIKLETQSAICPGNPRCQATKRHLNNS